MTKLFYVVDSKNHEKEIFETKEKAIEAYNTLSYDDRPRLAVYEVKNYYYSEDIQAWNYKDLSNTFKFISFI